MSRPKLRVLFVSSGNVKGFNVVPFIKEQGNALKHEGVEVHYFPIKGKGLRGYLKQVFQLRRYVKTNPVDLIHGHFVLSGWVAVLGSRGTPVVLSLMGSDAYGEYIGENKIIWSSRYLTLLTLLIQPFVKAIISKSPNIERYVWLKKKSFIIPNGIDIEKFKPDSHQINSLPGIDPDRRNVLFLGSQHSIRKNITLVRRAIDNLNDPSINLVNPYPVRHDEIPHYLNCTDVLAMSSYMEGSPNVVKEAMACNCPMVATHVGDVSWVIGEVDGCYISSFDPAEYAINLKKALDFAYKKKKTRGRERILDLQLDSQKVAKRVMSIYHSILKK